MPGNEFWLAFHRLYAAYSGEGHTADERANSIVAQFLKMPPHVRQELLADYSALAQDFLEIHKLVIAANYEAEKRNPRGGA